MPIVNAIQLVATPAGVAPYIQAFGDDTNIGMVLAAQGIQVLTSSVTLTCNGGAQTILKATPSGGNDVNFVQVSGGATGVVSAMGGLGADSSTGIVFGAKVSGTFRIGMQIGTPGAGGTITVGFYGSAGTSKPTVTGAKGGNAALASLMTALAGLGLVVDSTS